MRKELSYIDGDFNFMVSIGKVDGKVFKKKLSCFRMKDFFFFWKYYKNLSLILLVVDIVSWGGFVCGEVVGEEVGEDFE